MWNLKCTIVPVIIGATGIVTRSLRKTFEAVPERHSIDSLQKTAILGISHIIRKVLQWEAWSLTGRITSGSREVPGRKRLWQEIAISYNNNNNNNNNNIVTLSFWVSKLMLQNFIYLFICFQQYLQSSPLKHTVLVCPKNKCDPKNFGPLWMETKCVRSGAWFITSFDKGMAPFRHPHLPRYLIIAF